MKIHIKRLIVFTLAAFLTMGTLAAVLPTPAQAASGLNVTARTQAEIQAFINSHPAPLNDLTTYAVEPSITEPYSVGTLSPETLRNALNMVNQIRYIAGLNANVALDSSYNSMLAATTLVNGLNGKISHYPERPSVLADSKYDALYNLGSTGASKSNLGCGYINLNHSILNGYMADDDSSNIDRVGHRRWVLNPRMSKTGFGATTTNIGSRRFYAMYAFDESGSGTQTNVAWPAQVMPVEFFSASYPWSLSTGRTVDASTTTVKLVRNSDGKTWNFSSTSADGDFYVNNTRYGQIGCIIFRPNDLDSISGGDVFTVTVNVGGSSTVSYTVTFFHLDSPVCYTIHYFSDNSSEAMDQSGFEAGAATQITDRIPTRFGYEFLGWSTSPNAASATYQPGQIVRFSGDTNLYAVWRTADYPSIGNTFPKTYTADIAFSGATYYYRFTPTVSGNYRFESLCDGLDTVINIYDSKNVSCGSDDDSGTGYNFKLTTVLTAGNTYYIGLRFYGSSTGVLTMQVSRILPEITEQPADVTDALIGTTASFSITASGIELSFQWQYQMPGSTAWSDTSLTGATTSALYVPVTSARNGCKYRCKVMDEFGNTVYSDPATLSVIDGPIIIGHPANKTADQNSTARFAVLAFGDGLTYQWQYQLPDSTAWTNTTLTGARTDTLAVPATAARNGCKYRCVVTDAYGRNAASIAATLTVRGILSIATQPVSVTAASGVTAQFTVTALGLNLSYQWQYQMPGSTTWTNTTLTGCKTSLLTVPATTARNGCQYRCMVKDAAGTTLYTNPATLTVKALTITGHPGTKTVAANANAQFGVIASGVGLTYQWQYKIGSGAWTNTTLTGCKTSLLTVPATTARNGCQYRCVVKDAAGTTLYTNPATLTVKALVITGHPGTKTVAAGSNAQFGVIASGVGLTYQWQYKMGSGAWTNTTLTGCRTSLLTVPATTARNGCQYRCVVKDAAGTTLYTNPATLTVR